MQTQKILWTPRNQWTFDNEEVAEPQLVIYFGSPQVMEDKHYQDLREKYPAADILGCTTGAEISGEDVFEDSISAVAVKFEKTQTRSVGVQIKGPEESEEAGRTIGRSLDAPDLRALFVLSEGLKVNGTELVRGIKQMVGSEVVVTGGLAGDGADFGETKVGLNESPSSLSIAAVGFYGDDLLIGHGSFGGWETFGPKRKITHSEGNVLYTLDDQPALDLYKKYLGSEAENLPGSGLLYPLRIQRSDDPGTELVRTILSVDEETKSLTFAGDVPQGTTAQLMRGSFSRLVEGAGNAAEDAQLDGGSKLALLVSCIGRKLLMGQRISDEVEACIDVFGEECATVGFYSYGEISPHHSTGMCDLHNQTMTVTTLSER